MEFLSHSHEYDFHDFPYIVLQHYRFDSRGKKRESGNGNVRGVQVQHCEHGVVLEEVMYDPKLTLDYKRHYW